MAVVSREQERRKKALEELNAQLLASQRTSLSLGVSGCRIPLQSANPGPSRIPKPTKTTKPLPATGYVSESIRPELRHPLANPWQQPEPIQAPISPAPPLRSVKTDSPLRKTRVIRQGPPKQLVVTLQASKKPRVPQLRQPAAIGGQRRPGKLAKNQQKPTARRKKVEDKEERLRQLRIRYLSRKYWLLWLRGVYGRVSPSRARLHCWSVVKGRAMAAWREEWWQARREWKLSIRAECHNRYRLWQKVWPSWTRFVGMAREKRTRKEQVERFAAVRRCRVVWRAWCAFVLARRAKTAAKRRALQWRDTQLQRMAWQGLVTALQARRHWREMDALALHHWANTLQRKCYLSWEQCFTQRVLSSQQLLAASRHRCHALQQRTLRAWLLYRDHRRVKGHLNAQAREKHSGTLLRRCVHRWRCRLATARRLADFEEAVRRKAAGARKRKAFSQWRFYIELRLHTVYQNELALLCHTNTLKAKVFGVLAAYADQRRLHCSDQRLAVRCRAVWLMRGAWQRWLTRAEDCEEMKLAPRSSVARQHHSCRLTARVLHCWVAYTSHRKHRKSLHSQAELLFRETALPRCFSRWKQFVEEQQYKRTLMEEAGVFRRETLLSMLFYQWWRDARLRQDLRMLDRVAVLHREEVLKRSLLGLWRARTQERVKHFTHEHLAAAHYRRTLVDGALGRWRRRWTQAQAGALQLRRASQHRSKRLLQLAWSAWLRYAAKRRLSNNRRQFSNSHYHSALLQKTLAAWKLFHREARLEAVQRRAADQLHCGWVCRRALQQWGYACQLLRGEREKERMADHLWQASFLRKCWVLWQEGLAQRRCEVERGSEGAESLTRCRAVRALVAWRDHTHSRAVRRAGDELAERCYSAHLIRKSFSAWREGHALAVRKMLLQRQCVWFHNARLLSACYSKWRVELMSALIMKQKSTHALWHWSRALERKVLVAWFLYMLNGRRKRARFSTALAQHRGRLLATGVRQWIKVATLVKAQREEMALQQQAKSVQCVYACVRRCAAHWRATVAARQGRKRLSTLDRHPQTRPRGRVPAHSSPAAEEVVVWSKLSSRLHLPEAPPPQPRPAPRKLPSFLQPTLSQRPPHAITTLTPPPPPQPTSYPVLHAQIRDNALAGVGSFTFLPSSSSSSSDGRDTPLLLPPAAFAKTPAVVEAQEEVEEEEEEGGAQAVRTSVDLNDPTLHVEMVQLRDTLKAFHDLKTLHKALQAQVAHCTAAGEQSRAGELQAQLRSVAQGISRQEPAIKAVTARISQILAQLT